MGCTTRAPYCNTKAKDMRLKQSAGCSEWPPWGPSSASSNVDSCTRLTYASLRQHQLLTNVVPVRVVRGEHDGAASDGGQCRNAGTRHAGAVRGDGRGVPRAQQPETRASMREYNSSSGNAARAARHTVVRTLSDSHVRGESRTERRPRKENMVTWRHACAPTHACTHNLVCRG